MADRHEQTGLLLGAGASYEAGMPLVKELTDELKGWLTADQLRRLNEGWKSQGTGYADEVVEDFASVLSRDEMHYESLLGHLQVQSNRNPMLRQDYLGLYSVLVEIIYHLLRLRHENNIALIEGNLHVLEGMARLSDTNNPLWIFSLNHDMLVECVAMKYGIPVHSGFASGEIALPRRDFQGARIGELTAETITETDLASGMAFPQRQRGFNLLKFHGSLDVFGYEDGKNFARLLPWEKSVEGIINMLRVAQEELIFVDPQRVGPVKTTNEITFADHNGVMQFLRRSLVTGTYKFDRRHSQVLGTAFLREFESNLNQITHLLCIGYGFGDLHVNDALRKWLERSATRRMTIVAPGASLPSFLLHMTPEVSVVSKIASEYLGAC